MSTNNYIHDLYIIFIYIRFIHNVVCIPKQILIFKKNYLTLIEQITLGIEYSNLGEFRNHIEILNNYLSV